MNALQASFSAGLSGYTLAILGTKESLSSMVCVTIEDPPISFSPFSYADCTMLSHFSFNDFIAVAFLDLAGDLDVQI